MKHIYFLSFFFICIFTYAQEYQFFQLELVDANIGNISGGGCSFCNYETNDDGLNQIFENHNVAYYQDVGVFSYDIEDLIGKFYRLSCEDCDANQLLQDLNNYSSVIRLANSDLIIDGIGDHFYNGLSLNLIDDSIGVPIGESNGVITTNNTTLNQIFIDNNVSIYQKVNIGTSFERYELLCDCSAIQLKETLDSNTSLFSETDYLALSYTLTVNDMKMEDTKLYPNPFSSEIKVETRAQIKTIEVYDILGKKIHSTTKVSSFENFAPTLTSGVYLLKITNQQGETLTKKLIKN